MLHRSMFVQGCVCYSAMVGFEESVLSLPFQQLSQLIDGRINAFESRVPFDLFRMRSRFPVMITSRYSFGYEIVCSVAMLA
jgi:hypothetical protein